MQTSIVSVQLSWNPLPAVSIDEFFYEIGFSAIQDCSSVTVSTLPQDYTIFMNTSSSTAVVTGLEPDTCFVFGVRVYSIRTGQPGEWLLSQQLTVEGKISNVYLRKSIML